MAFDLTDLDSGEILSFEDAKDVLKWALRECAPDMKKNNLDAYWSIALQECAAAGSLPRRPGRPIKSLFSDRAYRAQIAEKDKATKRQENLESLFDALLGFFGLGYKFSTVDVYDEIALKQHETITPAVERVTGAQYPDVHRVTIGRAIGMCASSVKRKDVKLVWRPGYGNLHVGEFVEEGWDKG